MTEQANVLRVPLYQLSISPRNARKSGTGDIAGLAASIRAHGLLQNLVVTPAGNDSEGYEVDAGGRRLAAMQLLVANGHLPDDFAVPCHLIDDEHAALEASTAENTMREPMHPADQFDAFRSMVGAGKPIEDVAAHFGVEPIVVRRRLKLANVAPQLVQIYRDGGMALDQLQALALTDDHDLQHKAWFEPKYDHDRNAWNIKRRIVQREVSSGTAVATYVGLEAYEAAGGIVRRDLFSDRGEAYLADAALLDKLALDKLEAIAQAERDAGWGWAEARISLDYSQLTEYPRHSAPSEERPLSDSDVARLAAIAERSHAIDQLLGTDQDLGDQEGVLLDELDSLEVERQAIEDRRVGWSVETMAASGVLVYLSSNGVEVDRARLKPGQKMVEGAVGGKAKSSAEPGAAAADKPKKATLSDKMVRRLTAHRTLALQESVAARPELALSLLVTQLWASLIGSSVVGSTIGIQATNVMRSVENIESDTRKSPAHEALAARIKGWQGKGMPKSGTHKSLAEWVAARSQSELLELLALATGLTLDAQHGSTGRDSAAALAELVQLDMTAWWQPDADRFLSHVPKSIIIEAVTEARGKAEAEPLAKLKADGAIAEAGKLLAGTGWLPKPLRGQGYAVKKKPSGSAAAKPTTAKKPAAKKAAEPKQAKTKPAKEAKSTSAATDTTATDQGAAA